MSNLGNKEIFARNLLFYIEQSGKTQKELADILNVPTSTFNNWVMANKYPRIDKIEMLANYFGIQKSDLIEEKQPEEHKKPVTEEQKKPVTDDGLTENQRKLIDFAKGLSEDQAGKVLQLLQSALALNK